MNLQWRIPQWFPDLSKEQLESLAMFHVELVKFNKAINLVSPATVPEADLTHFSDSVVAYSKIKNQLSSHEIADFGSGSGFPSVVFAILDNHSGRKWIAMDIDQRKVEFLKHCQRKIGLKDFSAVVSDLSRPSERAFSQVTCRAFAPLREIIKKYGHNISSGGEVLALKGRNWREEVDLIEKSVIGSTWNIAEHADYSLPMGDERRFIVKITKN
ncbi:MAG: class I SAM-dependent methyltransferase [Bdellovibrionales bacterium]|nr:class I SAM-dependent methyltransferase [Bdellovibrionales bacterium]